MSHLGSKVAGRLSRLADWFRRVELRWGVPPPTGVVIFEATNSDYLLPLCGSAPTMVLDVPARVVHLGWAQIAGTALLAIRGHGLQAAYFATLLRLLKPSIVITFIDNSDLFHRVARINSGQMRFLAIQNAARYDVVELLPDAARKIYLPEFACFGEYERDLYTEKGAQVGTFYPIGSLRESYFRRYWKSRGHDARNGAPEYDLCVVAEASPGWDSLYPGSEDAIGKIATYAVRYAKEHGLRLVIAGKRDAAPGMERARIHHRDVEVAWYEKYIGTETPITPRVRDQFTTYGLISRSRLSLALMSTALREATNRGCKILFCNYSRDPRWDFCVNGVWSLTQDGYDAFAERVTCLLSMPDEEYRAQSAGMATYVMNNDDERPTWLRLSEIVQSAVTPAAAGPSGGCHALAAPWSSEKAGGDHPGLPHTRSTSLRVLLREAGSGCDSCLPITRVTRTYHVQ